MKERDKKQFFEEVIRLHKAILYKVARVYCTDDGERQDLVQEMMIQIWLSVHKYNDKFKITTWLYRIALNVAISYYRKNTTRSKHQIGLEEISLHKPTHEDADDNEQQLGLLEKFIDELKEIDKALMLLYLEDKSQLEISEILGISVSNVGTKTARIKEKLKIRFSQIKSE